MTLEHGWRPSSDYFEALGELREAVAHVPLMIVCYGASRHVFPSGISRSMSQGTIADKLSVGQPARMADVVNIVESGPDVDVTTVEEQQHFFQHWLASLAAAT